MLLKAFPRCTSFVFGKISCSLMSSRTVSDRAQRTYADAVRALDSLQSNVVTLAKWNSTRKNDKSVRLTETMQAYFSVLDINPSKLSIIHVAGTKGKGSVSALTESILRGAGCKTGLFTSPHLVSPRERIRLNGAPISEDLFAQYFWICWDRLSAATTQSPSVTGVGASRSESAVLTSTCAEPSPKRPRVDLEMPPYFRFLTMLAVAVFEWEKVDAAVLEVGVGGRTDATNFASAPTVTAVTALGMDHMSVLGNTLAEIAFEKAGIFKERRPALALVQSSDEATQVLRDRAAVVRAPFCLVDADHSTAIEPKDRLSLALQGRHQEANAALASCLAAVWLLSDWYGTGQAGGRNDGAGGDSNPGNISDQPSHGELSPKDRQRLWSLVPPVVRQLDSKLSGLAAHDAVVSTTSSNADSENYVHRVPLKRSVLPDVVCWGLEKCAWPGRSQIVRGGGAALSALPDNVIMYFDVAHTAESIEACTKWFWSSLMSRDGAVADGHVPAVDDKFAVLFNCATSRDPRPMIDCLAAPSATYDYDPESVQKFGRAPTSRPVEPAVRQVASGSGYTARRPAQFHRAIFSTYRVQPNERHNKERGELSPVKGESINLGWQHQQAAMWTEALRGHAANGVAGPASTPEVVATIADALIRIQSLANDSPSTRWHVLVTGSVYLVGGLFEILKLPVH